MLAPRAGISHPQSAGRPPSRRLWSRGGGVAWGDARVDPRPEPRSPSTPPTLRRGSRAGAA